MTRPGMTVEARLLANSRDEDRGYVTLCRVWSLSKTRGGYGKINVGGRTPGTHCTAYELWVGPIPEGLQVNHHCDQRDCIRPDHLYAGSQLDNIADMVARGRQSNGRSSKTHCKSGHEFTSENTYAWHGMRQCRECKRCHQVNRG